MTAPDRGDDPATTDHVGLGALGRFGRDRVIAGRRWVTAMLERHRARPTIELVLRVLSGDRRAAGTIVGSAIAFRLFLFFVPLLLFAVGLAGFFGAVVTPEDVADAGITGNLAAQINTAFDQPTSTRWVAIGAGLIGMATTGRTLSKALTQARCLAWGLPIRATASVRVVGGIIGLLAGMGILATLANRVRQELGIAATGASFLAILVCYVTAWLLVSTLLPRPTSDPGTLLPGAILVGGSLTGLQALSQLYLPDRFERASQLYGAIGAAVVVLGWFFIAGRIMVVAMVVDAAMLERFGSISPVVFRLPLLRILPRRSAWLRRAFDLDGETPP